jgi:hypothetical protein
MLGAQGAEFEPPRSNEVNQYVLVHVEDVDRHFGHAKRFGARIVHPPGDRQDPLLCTLARRWHVSGVDEWSLWLDDHSNYLRTSEGSGAYK